MEAGCRRRGAKRFFGGARHFFGAGTRSGCRARFPDRTQLLHAVRRSPEAALSDLYDQFVYDDFPFTDTHPDWLASHGVLFGLDPAPVEGCRVLELGCGLGGNLVPLGELLPGATFVGVDRAARQIAVGREDVRALGLTNVDLRVLDILDVPLVGEPFDYIICHGVFSWVPPNVQDHILAVCGRRLAPQGLAILSYNVLPGWHLRGMIRDLLRREVGVDGHPKDRAQAARDVVQFMRANVPAERSTIGRWLKNELDTIESLSDAYLFFEHLVEDNQPMYFRDFAARAHGAGLAYLCDAEFASALPARYGPEVQAALEARGGGQIETEQWLDYLTTRFFRRSILCRADAPVDRHLTGERVTGLRATTLMARVEGGFRGAGGALIETEDPVVERALLSLDAIHPQAAPVATLAKMAGTTPEDLGATLLELFSHGHIGFGRWARPFVTRPGPHPRTTALARLKAQRGLTSVPNVQHESIALDSADRVLLAHLDGTRDHEALTDVLAGAAADGTVKITRADDAPVTDRAIFRELVEVKLDHLARAALLLA